MAADAAKSAEIPQIVHCFRKKHGVKIVVEYVRAEDAAVDGVGVVLALEGGVGLAEIEVCAGFHQALYHLKASKAARKPQGAGHELEVLIGRQNFLHLLHAAGKHGFLQQIHLLLLAEFAIGARLAWPAWLGTIVVGICGFLYSAGTLFGGFLEGLFLASGVIDISAGDFLRIKRPVHHPAQNQSDPFVPVFELAGNEVRGNENQLGAYVKDIVSDFRLTSQNRDALQLPAPGKRRVIDLRHLRRNCDCFQG